MENNTLQKDRDIEAFEDVEQMPELIGGLHMLQANVQYPETARSEGRVIVEFIVDENWNVVNPKVIRGLGGGTNKEAVRVIKLAKFKPGRQAGKPVPVRLSLPIIFRR